MAGVITDLSHWRVIFLGLLPFLAIAAFLAYPKIRLVTGREQPGDRDWRRFGVAVALAAGATSLFAGLGMSNVVLAIPFVIVGGIAVFYAVRRLMPAGTLRAAPGLPAAIATMALLNVCFFGDQRVLPLALTDVRHRSTAFAGLALTAATISWSAGSWVQAHYADTRSRRQVIRIGFVLIAIGCAGVAATLFEQVPVLLAPIAWLVAGLGIGLSYSGISLTVLQTAESGKEGMATSSMQIAAVLGFSFGAGIGGAWIAALSEGDDVNRNALFIQDLLMIGVLVLAFVIVRNIPAWPGRVKPPETAEAASDLPIAVPAD